MDKDPALTTGEIAHAGWVIAKAALRAARGGSPEKYTPELDAITAKARAREEAQAAVKAERERQAALDEARRKAERRAKWGL
ncbi:hypothetical protein [Kitasatospora acidiphila]|uniref:hypothetical protein n=1 Tax=Kitasatospora acidiphila TaxID=2567942 RepID=UPI003C794667